jgi:glycosyltransferase involved in cell wall biosynthesis
MKINLIFYLSEFVLGGAGNSIYKLCKNLPKNKFNISVICLNKCYYKKEFEKIKIKVYEINAKRSLFAFKKISKLINKITSRKFSSNIFVSNIYYSNILSIIFLRKFNFKIILIERTPLQELYIYYGLKDFLKKILFKTLIKFTFKKADCCIANSSFISKEYNNKYNLKFITINPPSFDGKLNLKKKSTKKNKEINFVTVCRLTKEKGLEKLIKIIPNIRKKIVLNIIGNGPELNYLKQITSKLNLNNNVKFLGEISPSKIKIKLKKYDCYINNSDFEGFPNTVVEALSVGIPVFASQSYGGINEILNSNKYGLIYKNENHLTKIINNFIDDKISFNFNKKNLSKHLNKFNEVNNLKKYKKIFKNLSK